MKYERFEDLPVWNTAIQLGLKIYALTAEAAFKGQGNLRDQLPRAAVSGSNNIAEGFERGMTNELLTFRYIAPGSAGDVGSMLCLLERLPNLDELKAQIALAHDADNLQISEIKGQRYLNKKTRNADRQNQEREKRLAERCQFLEEIIARETARLEAARRVAEF